MILASFPPFFPFSLSVSRASRPLDCTHASLLLLSTRDLTVNRRLLLLLHLPVRVRRSSSRDVGRSERESRVKLISRSIAMRREERGFHFFLTSRGLICFAAKALLLPLFLRRHFFHSRSKALLALMLLPFSESMHPASVSLSLHRSSRILLPVWANKQQITHPDPNSLTCDPIYSVDGASAADVLPVIDLHLLIRCL